MTQDADLKSLVRARMRRTGENYTTARAAVLATPPPSAGPSPAALEQQRLVGRWFTAGRLREVPARRKVRVAILLELLRRFRPFRDYPEREVNELLRTAHPDVAYLRRELVDYGYLTRADGVYRVAQAMPERPPLLRDELPAWEAEWLPGFLAGSD